MKLYGSYTSPFVRHVRIALLETQQAFEFIETDQAGSSAQSPRLYPRHGNVLFPSNARVTSTTLSYYSDRFVNNLPLSR